MISSKDILLILISLSICVIFLFIGYLFGRINSVGGVYSYNHNKNKSDNLPVNTNISIDDTKYVVDIKTDNLEKKYDSLGEVKKSTDNISQSINKLKKLKG